MKATTAERLALSSAYTLTIRGVVRHGKAPKAHIVGHNRTEQLQVSHMLTLFEHEHFSASSVMYIKMAFWDQ